MMDALALDAPCAAGLPVTLAPGVRRLTAPNPGPMTGTGTNTYLVGERELVVLDPGPPSEAHRAAIVAAVGGARVVAVAVTHTHRDHSSLATPLARHFGAPRVGAQPRHGEWHDPGFVADRLAGEGTVLATDAGELVAVATPGHASNHLCWRQPGLGLLYTGDHVLGAVSPVIAPPDGDMGEYLESLARLRALG
ncbi:MAG: MBL fold metallo-hydrolase, partial [Proteobacteria bacterium]|nr:MBL fold metallo-hydrolase [Pseudomonadota bacterium]